MTKEPSPPTKPPRRGRGHDIVLHEPVVEGSRVTFSFSVEPASALYRRTAFHLEVDEGFDLAAVPMWLWWRIALLCLHAHWPLLPFCRVRVPVALEPEGTAFWSRLHDLEARRLQASARADAPPWEPIQMAAVGPAAPLPPRPDGPPRAVASFSGGKDSLLQAGLLLELTDEPVFVTTTSPMPPLEDHVVARRREVLEGFRARGARLVEVRSDLRAMWDNAFSRDLGFGVSVNEMTDTFLYTAATAMVASALAATHVFQASELEVSLTARSDGRLVEHPHAMYGVPTQRALDRLLAPAGLRVGSLITPLASAQVQTLLVQRYPDLAPLQFSCWRVKGEDAMCNACSQCLRVALRILASGGDPRAIGIDLARLLPAMSRWRARGLVDVGGGEPDSVDDLVRQRLHAQVLRDLRALDVDRAGELARTGQGWRDRRRRRRLRRAHRRLLRRHRRLDPGRPDGLSAGWLEHVDPWLREQVGAIYREAFPGPAPAGEAGHLARTRSLIEDLGATR